MADYKKFRMVGPVAVYHHKDTGVLATKDAHGYFKEWKSIGEIDAWAKQNFSDNYVELLLIHSGMSGSLPYLTTHNAVWDKKDKAWFDTDRGGTYRLWVAYRFK